MIIKVKIYGMKKFWYERYKNFHRALANVKRRFKVLDYWCDETYGEITIKRVY